mgnify:CR=1 FL=1
MVDSVEAERTSGAQDTLARLEAVIALQKAAIIKDGPSGAELRKDRLERCIQALRDNADKLADAMAADYGGRSRAWSMLSDVGGAIESLRHAKTHVAAWMKPEERKPSFPLWWFGARARVHFQPKGIVGVIGPWSSPVVLTLAPMAGALAAGNRVIIKPSERTPRTARVLQEMCARAFHEEEVAVLLGGPDMAAAIAENGVDHIVFTGKAEGGRGGGCGEDGTSGELRHARLPLAPGTPFGRRRY